MGDAIIIRGAREHNLKGIDLDLPRGHFIVLTGLSGSGKSSLAFDTVYAEGHRRYVESLSTYARQFLERVDKPDVDLIEGISPAIAIEQRNPVKHARSTVGTATEIYDYLRLLYAKVGTTFCPDCGEAVTPDTVQQVVDRLICDFSGDRCFILFSLPVEKPEQVGQTLRNLLAQGFLRVWLGEDLLTLSNEQIPETTQESKIFVVVDRLQLDEEVKSRLADSLEVAFSEGGGKAWVRFVDGPTLPFSRCFICPRCDREFEEPTPLFFSFNNPRGACQNCGGFGNKLDFDVDLIIPDRAKSLAEGAIEPWTRSRYRHYFTAQLRKLARKDGVDLFAPFGKLSKRHQRLVLEGTKDFRGVLPFFERLTRKKYKLWVRVFLRHYMSAVTCQRCGGSRLREEALHVRVGGLHITDLCQKSVREVQDFFSSLSLTVGEKEIARDILKQIASRLSFLTHVGVDYLTLDRLTRTLSGGEAQRINLANQLGAQLTGTLYILDEPTVGLHPRDNAKLLEILKSLTQAGNTLLVVEHDRDVITHADCLVDLGPGAGEQGGHVVYAGPAKGIKDCKDSLTAAYLRGDRVIAPHIRRRVLPTDGARRRKKVSHSKGARAKAPQRRSDEKILSLFGARENNLKGIDLHIPLGGFTCITGVSGSGKSTLIHDTLYNALNRIFHGGSGQIGVFKEIQGFERLRDVVLLDQNPIGRTPRSNPVTYIKAYDAIRQRFAATSMAKLQGYGPGYFSFNVPGGRCDRCKGEGHEKIEMHFMADVYIRCPECEGTHFRSKTLEVKFRGKSIHDVLCLTVDEALRVFEDQGPVVAKLKVLADVGLGYLRLGQPATTLSGGEAQRLKIATELAKREPRDILYLLDEPTTGLHFYDVEKLLHVLHRLVDLGNTVVVIEHNLDVIRTADHVVDLGPEGGDLGGTIVAEGPPEKIAAHAGSYTGHYLQAYLAQTPQPKLKSPVPRAG